jgi:WD40 repeat protein
MPEPQYDLFLSHASEDDEWCEMLAERLRNESVRVWFDKWELRPGANLLARINEGLKASRKMVAVFSSDYFRDGKVWTRAESLAFQSPDILSKDRPVIPIWIKNLRDEEIEPTLRPILSLDFRNNDDFELRFRQLIQALDLPRREYASEEEFEFREHRLDPAERGRRGHEKGRRFVDEVAAIYRALGFDVKQEGADPGARNGLQIQKRDGIRLRQDFVECSDKLITAVERDQILIRQTLLQKKFPRHGWIAISARGFTEDARATLEDAGFDCGAYAELLRELVPLDNYVEGLIDDYEKWVRERWNGEDWFIRPDLKTDIVYEQMPALTHLGKWLGEERRNQLIILGDLGTGKSTLAGFLAYNLARSFRDAPLLHPAPVMIPLKDVRKEVSLEGIIISHFSQRGLRDINFTRFEHLVRLGKIILIFDAFDEMADRVRWDVTQSNFRELSRAAELQGKVILTCRTHYFKDHSEQVKVIGQGPRLSDVETELYREMRKRSNAEVVYLQEFDDRQIQDYLKKARPQEHEDDWRKILQIYNLKDLATRPLLLDMIVKSLPKLSDRQEVNAANLYNVYTNIWIDREEDKGRKFTLDRKVKLALMLELSWRLWRDEKPTVHYRDLAPFVGALVADKRIEIGDEEITDVASEMQGASFLKRDDAGNFCYMHRSFGEFFIACKIKHALADDAALRELLNTRRYDQKMIYFLTQLDEQDLMREPLRQILVADYQPRISENALQLLYWSARIRAGMQDEICDSVKAQTALAARIPAGSRLAGANLQEISLECADLTEADLSGADLTKANLNHSRLDRAILRSAVLIEASFENALARDADFRHADLNGVSFHQSDLSGGDFSGARNQSIGCFVGATLTSARGILSAKRTNLRKLRAIAQLGADAEVPTVTYSPDGELIAVGSFGVILLYRANSDVLLRIIDGHTDWVNSVAFAPDGRMLASGSSDNSVKLWHVDSGELLRSLDAHADEVWSVAFAPNGLTLVSGSSDKSVKLWHVDSGELLRSHDAHSNEIRSVAFAPDGRTLASGSSDKSVKLWHVDSGELLRSLDAHSNGVMSVAFAPDGRTLASGSSDKSVKLWQVDSGELLRSLNAHSNGVMSVAFAPDGRTLASGSSDNSVKLWQVDSGKLLRSLDTHSNWVWSVTFAPDGRTLASGSSDHSVKLWRVDSGEFLRSLNAHSYGVWSVAFAPDGQMLASGSSGRSVKLWQVDSGELLRSLDTRSGWVWSVAFAPDGRTLANGGDYNLVKLWRVDSGELLRSLKAQSYGVWSVAFAPDGRTLASGADKSVNLWQVNSGELLRSLDAHSDGVWSVAFAPDGQTLASGSDDHSVKLWQVESGELLRSLNAHSKGVKSVAFAPDGLTLASGSSDKSVNLWQVSSGKLQRSLGAHSQGVLSVAFAPDGQTLASGSSDKSVRLWQVDSGEILQSFEGHLGPVSAVAIAPNGRYLVAAVAAGRLQFWDIASGETFLYRYSFGPGAWLDLLPDGRFDASPEGMRYLGYTEEGTFNYYTAESLVKEFYAPEAVRMVLEKYTK